MTVDKNTFITYPFPKHLLIDVKLGHYKVIGDEGKEEIIEADNAKDAVDKSTLKEVNKIEYLGFCKKSILGAKELIEDNKIDAKPEEPAEAPPAKPEGSAEAPPAKPEGQ